MKRKIRFIVPFFFRFLSFSSFSLFFLALAALVHTASSIEHNLMMNRKKLSVVVLVAFRIDQLDTDV